jgi:hypothetical protein
MHSIHETHRRIVTKISYVAYFFNVTRNHSWPVLWTELHYLSPYNISDSSFPIDNGLNQMFFSNTVPFFRILNYMEEVGYWSFLKNRTSYSGGTGFESSVGTDYHVRFPCFAELFRQMERLYLLPSNTILLLPLPLNPFESSFKIILSFPILNFIIYSFDKASLNNIQNSAI